MMNPGMIVGSALIGLLVGILVGLTGVGGGLLLMPLLISVLGVPPLIAVGSDTVISCVTKIGAGGFHWYHGNVRWRLVLRLASGSILGAFLGVLGLARVREVYGSAVNDFLRIAVGVLLVLTPILYLMAKPAPVSTVKPRNEFGITVIGFVAGCLVGATSIGAGSVVLILLLALYGLPPAVTVGTDVIHGALLAGVAGLLQFKLLGNVDPILVGTVLAGSIPGSILGVNLARHLSSLSLKRVLCVLLMALGARMLWVVLLHAN